jgi:hypothetical protein
MLVILSVILLLFTPAGMHLIQRFKPGFTFPWLIATAGALLAWGLTLASFRRAPDLIPLISWEPAGLFTSSPAFIVDRISWPFSLSITVLALAVLLTAVVRMQNADIKAWTSTLVLAGVSLAAVNAGNPLTLLLAWAALDLTEIILLFLQVNDSKARERIVFAFSTRACGILLLLWGMVSAHTPGTTLTFESIPQHASLFFLLAAGIRLGVLPLHLPYGEELDIRRGVGTLVRLAPAAASLVLLPRLAEVGIPQSTVPYLLAVVSFSALFASISWGSQDDETSGRYYWVLGMSSLAAAAAISGQSAASLAWGIALLLSGGLLFLTSHRHKNLLPLGIMALFSVSALPFSPTWAGMQLYRPPLTLLHLPLFLSQALLLGGYIRRLLVSPFRSDGLERWGWLIYPLGLGMLLASHIAVHVRNFPPLSSMNLAEWIGGGAALGLAAVAWLLQDRLPPIPGQIRSTMELIFSLRWAYRLLWNVYNMGSGLINRTNRVLEGEGGVLWAFVLLAIIVSWVVQSVLGG